MPSVSSDESSPLALARLQERLRRRMKEFHRITGMNAVTALAASLPKPGEHPSFPPPIHPQCARRLRGFAATPCAEQWSMHIRSSRRSPRVHHHVCPIGMRCACIPIYFDDELVGIAKLVTSPASSEAAFSAALEVLKLVTAATTQELVISILSDAVRELRHEVFGLKRVVASPPILTVPDPPIAPGGSGVARRQSARLVQRAVVYLQEHYEEPSLSLPRVAAALGCNPRYLTTCFTLAVGERMHTYLLGLRVSRACSLLVSTPLSIKEVAFASGFSAGSGLASTFRRRVGVSAGEYRRIFSSIGAERPRGA